MFNTLDACSVSMPPVLCARGSGARWCLDSRSERGRSVAPEFALSATGLCGPHQLQASSTDMYNNDVGQESAQKLMKQIKDATLYFAS